MKHSAPAREPLLNRAVVTALVGLAVALGLITTDIGDQLVVVLVAVLPLVTGVWARRVVTPLSDPRNAGGVPLVPAVVDLVLPGEREDEGG